MVKNYTHLKKSQSKGDSNIVILIITITIPTINIFDNSIFQYFNISLFFLVSMNKSDYHKRLYWWHVRVSWIVCCVINAANIVGIAAYLASTSPMEQ